MRKSEMTSFWIGLLGAALLSFILYRLLRPQTAITPAPLVVGKPDIYPKNTTEASAVPRDSLTKIRGIGPATEKRLNEVGIVTYSQLAEMESSDLAKYSGKRWNPNDWIEQAREFSKD